VAAALAAAAWAVVSAAPADPPEWALPCPRGAAATAPWLAAGPKVRDRVVWEKAPLEGLKAQIRAAWEMVPQATGPKDRDKVAGEKVPQAGLKAQIRAAWEMAPGVSGDPAMVAAPLIPAAQPALAGITSNPQFRLPDVTSGEIGLT
jgi:hypothetical protein